MLPPSPVPGGLVTLRVEYFARHAASAALLRLGLGAVPFAFAAGQAVRLGRHGQSLRIPYSVASAPADLARQRRLEFLVGIDEAAGGVGPHLAGLEPGQWVDVEGPAGTFVLGDVAPTDHLLLVAGGTGVAPLRAMWREALAGQHPPRISVVYSARTAAHLAFTDELDRLRATAGTRVLVALTRKADPRWQSRAGRLDLARLAPIVNDADVTRALVCGPEGFVANVTEWLRALGLGPGRVQTEQW